MMQQKPQVLITGASGFIGQHLAAYLTQQGYQVIGLTRNPNRSSSQAGLRYIHRLEQISQEPIDYVINLAGENIGQSRWTEKRKLELINSRIETTRQVFEWLQQNRIQPHRIISGSAIGYYGIDPQEQWSEYCNESSPPQDIFMSELCQRWEHQAKNNSGQQVSIIRLGVVFARNGGILSQMLMPIRFNLVGKIGHGRQPVTWIHINDVVRAITFILQQPEAKADQNLRSFQADQFVLTTGAWSEQWSRQLNIQLPVQPVHGQMILFKTPENWLPTMCMNRVMYLIPRSDGHIVCGSSMAHQGFNTSINPQTSESILTASLEMVPELAQFPIVKQWAGLRPGSPEGIPYIGKIPDINNLWANFGQFVMPQALLEQGFEFQYPDLNSALTDLLDEK